MACDQHWRSTSHNSLSGLISSHPYLDGIPFKISPAVKPHGQPVLPPEVLRGSVPCQALHEEYSFETEEAVLAWSKAREEAMARAAAESESAKEAMAAQAAAEPQENGTVSNDDQTLASATNDVQTSKPQVPRMKPPWQLTSAASLSSSILTPTPIQTSKAKVQSPLAAKTAVDLALFEKEDDLFDNMELQTINDMEELRTLLGGTMEGGSQGQSANPDVGQILRVNGREGVGDLPSQGTASGNPFTHIFSNIPEMRQLESTNRTPTSAADSVNKVMSNPFGSSTNSSAEPAASDCSSSHRAGIPQHWVQFGNDSDSTLARPSREPVLGGELPQQFANSKAFKPVLPPIQPRGKSLSGQGAVETGDLIGSSASSVAQTSVELQSEAQSSIVQPPGSHGFMGSGMSQSAYAMSSSASAAEDVAPSSNFPPCSQHLAFTYLPGSKPADTAAASITGSLYSHYSNQSPVPINGLVGGERGGGLRSAKSSPDLSARSASPFQGIRPSSSSQSWNPYTPLPPTSVQGTHWSSPPSQQNCSEEQNRTSHSPRPFSSSSPACVAATSPTAVQLEYDPYPVLSSKSKTFVNSLTSMGFSRSRVSRAVEKFGTDEREVLDHLLNVDRLVERKVPPALAETSLQLFKNNMQKAEQFLDLYHQFQELGFTGDRIQSALVRHQLDRDKALDYLTT